MFFIKNCIHAKHTNNITNAKNIVSTVFMNLNFDIISLLTLLIVLKHT